MSAYQQCKEAGLSGLAELAEMTGVPKRTLQEWFNTKPLLFGIIVKGCGGKKLYSAE